MEGFSIADRFKKAAVSGISELANDTISQITSGIPRLVAPPDFDEHEDVEQEQETPKMQAPPEPEPITQNTKRTLDELEAKARNKSKLVKELLSTVNLAANMGVTFSTLEKGDRQLVEYWDNLIRENPNTVVSAQYLAAKERVETFEEEIKDVKTAEFDENVTQMIYEAFLYDYIEKNKQNGVKPSSPLWSIVEGVIIICGNALKLYIFNKILSTIRKINNA